ncbi:hypothetical protein DAI22_07g179400 [Oryza sativa Japonica Group]|nr:hypothetical protein DAI22_07g179400 [Oryza sativa Japonica Group]
MEGHPGKAKQKSPSLSAYRSPHALTLFCRLPRGGSHLPPSLLSPAPHRTVEEASTGDGRPIPIRRTASPFKPPIHVRSKARPRTCPWAAPRESRVPWRSPPLPSPPRAPHVRGPLHRRIAIGRPRIRRQWHGPTASRRGSADRRGGGDGAVTASGSRRGEGEREREREREGGGV